ncbi:MAG: DUF3137 domain-containing protein [Campylobacteraceae bacterium]|nr:DUF3137 domain-containing protein [Campylobacteraceae bacterium]
MEIKELEKKRKSLLRKLFISGGSVSLVFIFGFFMMIKTADNFIVPLLFLVGIWLFIIYGLKFSVTNSFIALYNETLFKDSGINAFKYSRNASNLINHIKNLSNIKFGKFNANDEFSGEINGVWFQICDARLDLSHLNFKGRVFKAEFNKNFENTTLISNLGVIKNDGLQKIAIDSPKFGLEFEVFSDELKESLYILNPVLLERLEILVGKNRADILLYKNEILILVDSRSDALEPNLFKPIDEINSQNFKDEFLKFKELIKFLRLDRKL